MMNRKWVLILAAALLTMTMGVTHAAEYKFGFVEVARLLNQSPQIADIRDKLKKEFSRRDQELLAQAKQIKSLTEQLKRDGAVMSDSESKRLEKDIISRKRKLKNAQSAFQEDLSLRQNEELQKVRKQIAEVIQAIAKENKFDLVLESGVVYASDRANITDAVLAKMQKEFEGK
ncbi:MAG: OmpH family outer membrane protein [Chromatiales bacterium]|jgi:outer membrane protein